MNEFKVYNIDTKTGEKRIQHPSTHFPLMPFFRRPGHQGVFVTRQAYERLGGYDTSLHYTMDLDLLMRATSAGMKFKHVPEVVWLWSLRTAFATSAGAPMKPIRHPVIA